VRAVSMEHCIDRLKHRRGLAHVQTRSDAVGEVAWYRPVQVLVRIRHDCSGMAGMELHNGLDGLSLEADHASSRGLESCG
jgi:hypothetical protein